MRASVLILDEPMAEGWRHAGAALLAELLPAEAYVRAAVAPAEPDAPAAAVQHVTPDGRRARNGVLWLERAGVPVTFDESLPPRATRLDFAGPSPWPDTLTARLEGCALTVSGADQAALSAAIDYFGRPVADPGGAAAIAPRSALRIGILSTDDRLLSVYPAVTAALGDAADALGLSLAVEHLADLSAVAAPLDGLVLPGGPDMGEVEPLVAASHAARTEALPTLGLCLGMQAMCLDIARCDAGLPDAMLEEIAPNGPVRLFQRLRRTGGDTFDRLGDRRVQLQAASGPVGDFAAAGAGLGWRERMNHRFGLSRDYRSRLAASGLELSAVDPHDDTVDAVSLAGQPFFLGLSGHPELTSRRQAPHPAILAFLHAAARRRGLAPGNGRDR